MTLKEIELLNFKNIADARLEFSQGLNCFVGSNGMGKSNLLEAIHFLCLARGMSSMPEAALIRHGEQMLSVKGSFLMDSGADETISAGIVKGKGKTVKRNGKEYDRISSHIGHFPLVSVTPADSVLVSGPGEGRRRLMDMVISQADASYLSRLIRYNRSQESRNKMLRAGVRDALLYESVESGMEEAAAEIHATRRRWAEGIAPILADYYYRIAGTGEEASIKYRSVLYDRSLAEVLADTRNKDMVLGYTSQGIHRDELDMYLGQYSMRRLGSQGQIKTFTIALRLAVFDYLRESGGVVPLLLLDDIFDKLDAGRVERIISLVGSAEGFGQIFITDTNRKHLDEIIGSMPAESRLFQVEDGEFGELRN